MAGHEYNLGGRDPTRVYTPSLDSDEDLPHVSSLDVSDKSYRLFLFRKDGRSWVHALCTESSLPESDIKTRAKRPRKPKHGVDQQLDKMSPPRRHAIDDLVERIKRRDPDGENWDIVAIDNDKPELTKRTGEVVAFSVILARAAPTRQSTKPVSQERRRSTLISPTQQFAVPLRRGSKSYHTSPTRDGRNRQSQDFRSSQPILEDDPFGSTSLFSPDGKPIDLSGSKSHPNLGLPAHIPLDEPIGTKPQKSQKGKSDKGFKRSKENDHDNLDLDALLGQSMHTADLLSDPLLDDDHHLDHHFSDSDSPIDVGAVSREQQSRGRRREERKKHDTGLFMPESSILNGFDDKKRQSTTTSRPRPPSIHIPKESKYASNPIEVHPLDTPKYSSRPIEVLPQDKYGGRQVNVASSNRRRTQSYYGSKHGSETAPSAHSYSDQSVLEAEYEEYSSSGSSLGHEQHQHVPGEWQESYAPSNGRYERATRDHRRGPPSPQQPRYEPEPVPYSHGSATSRRPRHERFASEGAIQKYYTPTTTSRPAIVTQQSTPRYEPRTSYNQSQSAYNHDTGLVPYPSDLRRRDSIKTRDAELYIQSELDKDREIEILQRERDMARSERDLARREAEMHQEVARRASVSTAKPRTPKYTHEPRMSRRYTEAYYG